MTYSKLASVRKASLLVAGVLLAPILLLAQAKDRAKSNASNTDQTTVTATASGKDRWLHVRVVNMDSKEETVRVNVPLELAEKVLPTITHDRLHNGKVTFDSAECKGVDLRALAEAVRTSKDGEFVTVQAPDADVRVAKQNGRLIVHVLDKKHHGDEKHWHRSDVEVKVPMTVVDALFSAGKDELDIVAALRVLSTQGDTELVSVKGEDNESVRVWMDSKNVSE
jgi:hypothetical protein